MQGFSSYELRYIIVKVLGELPIFVEVTKIWFLNFMESVVPDKRFLSITTLVILAN